MESNEIEVPKEVGKIMVTKAKRVFLGELNGANKQYRDGKLHIREYDDKYLVHMDKVDPKEDPIGHLIYDAPEVLVGLACGIYGSALSNIESIITNKSKKESSVNSLVSALALGYTGYFFAKKLKKQLR